MNFFLIQTRFVVTHIITYLPELDLIVVLKDGTISEIGTYRELLHNEGAFSEYATTYFLEKVDSELTGNFVHKHFRLLCL